VSGVVTISTTEEVPFTTVVRMLPFRVKPNVRRLPKLDEDIPTEIDSGLLDGIVKLIRIGPG
jgi:hypothetical protein